MRSAIVEGGRFRVFEDGHVNRIKNGVEEPATLVPTCRDGKYLIVTYSENKVQKRIYVHRLVALAFIPNPGNLPQVNHIDGNTRNNAVENLEWVTCKENVNHAVRTGLAMKSASAEPCPVCGRWTLAKGGVCPSCAQKIRSDARKIDRMAAQLDKYGAIDLKRCSPSQTEYVLYAMEGLSPSEIARRCNVSKQCVNEALHKAEEKSNSFFRIPCTVRNQVISLVRKAEKARLNAENAISEYENARSELSKIESHINAIASSYGVPTDELLNGVSTSA